MVAADKGKTLTCTVVAHNTSGNSAAVTSAAFKIPAAVLPLVCSGRAIEILELGAKGKQVHIFGLTLARLASQMVMLTSLPGNKAAGTAKVAADGTFTADVKKPSGKGRVRYKATVALAQQQPALAPRASSCTTRKAGTGSTFRVTGGKLRSGSEGHDQPPAHLRERTSTRPGSCPRAAS